MKPLALAILLVVTDFLPQFTSAQSANITFNASLKSHDNTSLSDVYVRIYAPGQSAAVDSVFTDENGRIELQLPFSWSGTYVNPGAMAATGVVGPMKPNVLFASSVYACIEYIYPSAGTLFFRDVQGKVYQNGSHLPPGVYFYYLVFEDGSRSGVHKMLLAEQCRVGVDLRNLYQGDESASGGSSPGGHSRKSATTDDTFIAEFIKDGFVTLRDTILIDGTIIDRSYQLEAVDPPVAGFSWSGDLKAGHPVMFDASASYGAYGETLVCSWDFGDGKKGQSVAIPHIFIAPGSYEVKLTVAGKFGVTHTVTKVVTITADQAATHFDGTVIAGITDMDGYDLKDVLITLVEDGRQVQTDHRGMAVMEDLPIGIPLHFSITREGYVTQVAELTIPGAEGEALFFAQLKERAPAVTFSNAEFGGTKTGRDGAAFSLPVSGLVKQDGTAVKGDVQLTITPVDVAYDAAAFPGSFTGYRTDGQDGVLLSYGVAEYHFEQDGEALQLAAGKKATILIPVYTSGASPGDEIPLWSVDEESGRWVEEGSGTVVASDDSPTGLAFMAEIGHLSWWNCDDWEEDRKRDGLCYRFECTSAICVRVKVGCWVSGAMRDKKKSEPGAHSSDHISQDLYEGTASNSLAAREDIPPVFEVREFIPETGLSLRFPTTRDVLLDARAFGPGNQLLGGRHVVEASNPSDTFSIELTPVIAGDTLNLEMNSYREFYLEPDEMLTFRVEIPSEDEYRIYAEPGGSPRLYGIYNVLQDDVSLLSGDIGTQEHWVDLHAGILYISIAGHQSTSEGNFYVGIQERNPMLEGDTLSLELNVPMEEYLEASHYKHFRVEIPSEGLYRVDLKYGASPSLKGRFEVHGTGTHIYRFLTTDDHGYILATPGEYLLSVAGLDLKQEGNFIIGIWEIDATPLQLNDSIHVNMPETEQFHMYSIQSPVNTILNCRFHHVAVSFVSGAVSLVAPSGKILGEGNLYAPGARIVSPLARDSVYFIEVERYNSTFDYVLIPGEEASIATAYGDTINERLRYKGDKDMFHFSGTAGDRVSIMGFQPDYQLSKGYFSLWNEAGKELTNRMISYNNSMNDYEIVYEIPETGTYSLVVGSHQDDTGSYRLILQEFAPLSVQLDDLTEMEVEAGKTYYSSFELSQNRLVHFSILSESGSGYFHLWDAAGNRLTEFNNIRAIRDYYNASYTGQLGAGRYFIRIDNETASRLFINLAAARKLSFDDRGKAAFMDTITLPNRVNAYAFRGKTADGIHGILRKNGDELPPQGLELKYYRKSGAGSVVYPASRSADYYALDDTFLHEAGARLSGEYEDTVFVVVAFGRTAGSYKFSFHHVDAATDIAVDDDFVQYPGAQTSSHIAAGYAVKPMGAVTIANGEYTSMLPMKIEAGYVTLTGQDEEQVLLRNVYNKSSNPVLYFYSEWGYIGNMSLSCGVANYYAIESLYGGLNMDHIHIKPLEGNTVVAGGIKAGGDGITLTNITMTNSMWGIQLSSKGGLITDCNLLTMNTAIQLGGDDIVIRDNVIEVTSSNRAIQTTSGWTSSGNQLIEGNTIVMTREGYSDGTGIINAENFTGPEYETNTIIRNNTIRSAGNNAAFNLVIGNPPSTILVENNTYTGTFTSGGKALSMQAGRFDGASTILVRNNTFSGLSSESSIMFYGSENITEDDRFAIYNNSFRLAAGTATGAEHCFVEARTSAYTYTDTANIYLVNNIFQGNGTTSLLKCSDAFSVYADYNTVYQFSSYLGGTGNIIGTAHDITGDPLFTDDNLHVGAASPAIDKGADDTVFPGIPGTDKVGVVRPQGAGYDMGAYEQ